MVAILQRTCCRDDNKKQKIGRNVPEALPQAATGHDARLAWKDGDEMMRL